MVLKLINNSLVLKEALSIPKCINFFNENDKNDYNSIKKKIIQKKIKYVVTVARGTSDCAALYASYVFAKYLGLTTYSLAPSLITLEESKFNFENTLVIIISQSGMSEDLIECETAAKNMGAETMVICNNQKSPLIDTSNNFFYINAGEEKSVAATKTFVLTLIIIIKLVFTITEKNKFIDYLQDLPRFLQKENDSPWNHKIINNNLNNGFIISRGVGYAISSEMSLKFKELCLEQIEPFSSAEVMHGPKSLIEDKFKVFILTLNDNSSNSVEKDTKTINQKTNHLYKISSSKESNESLFYSANKFSELDCITVMSKFYPWIINYSIEKGLDPDSPRYLSKITKTF